MRDLQQTVKTRRGFVGVLHALSPALHRLERMEASDGNTALAGVPTWRWVAMFLLEQPPIVVPLHTQHLAQALVHEHVLTPVAWPRAELCEVHLAALHASHPSLHRLSREDLQWPMQAHPAVV